MREKVEESLYSKMQPSWMYSEDKRLSALITAENRKLYPDHPKGLPFKVVLYFDGSFCHEFFVDSIEDGHEAMRRYVENK